DRAVDGDLRVRQFAPTLRPVGEEHADAAVDVDHRVDLGRTRLHRHLVQLVALAVQVLRELLELERALVEGERLQPALADAAAVLDRGEQVDSLDTDGGQGGSGARVDQFRGIRGAARGPPGTADV